MEDIRIETINKSFGDKKVLEAFGERIAAGETAALLGPSGCGKTTLLKLIAGVEKPDAGIITGVPERVACVFQEDRLLPGFSVKRNLRFVTGPGAEQEAEEVLGELGLGDSLREKAAELSGGMQRRVAIARALLFDAELVLMDEPFKGLDEKTKLSVMECVKKRTAGKTVILVTHDRTEAEFFSARCIEMTAVRGSGTDRT